MMRSPRVTFACLHVQFDLQLFAKVDDDRARLRADVKKLEATVAAQATALAKKDKDIGTLKGQITLGKHTYLPALFAFSTVCT
jgi:hypothetical protein